MTNGSLMKVKRIAESSAWSIQQYFGPALNDNWSFLELPFYTGFTVCEITKGNSFAVGVLVAVNHSGKSE